MTTCPVCESEFDERAYQVVIPSLGSFDSIACADVALRRARRRRDLPRELMDVLSSARKRSQDVRPPTRTDRAH